MTNKTINKDIATKANLAKAKDAKLWAFQIMLMAARLPNTLIKRSATAIFYSIR